MDRPSLPPAARPKRRRLSKRKVGLVLALPALAVWLMAGRGASGPEPAPAPPAPRPKAAVSCADYPFKNHSPKLKARLPAYKALSLRAGVRPVADGEALQRALADRSINLVEVRSDERIWVAPMDHGSPYLTPAAAAVLHGIASDFQARIAGSDLAGTRIRITSLFRTRRDQRDLGRSNVNATRDADAPHTHGTSMDLSYMKFAGPEGELLELQACQQVFLAETLAEAIVAQCSRDKRIFATKEKRQACYHISVCR